MHVLTAQSSLRSHLDDAQTPGLNRYSTFHQEVKAGAKSHKPLSKKKRMEKKGKEKEKKNSLESGLCLWLPYW
jgi:hypothetical protein